MNLMAIDLEMNQPSGTIIQVGIAVGCLHSGNLLYAECYDIYTDEQISAFIKNLTGITQNDVNSGMSLNEAYRKLVEIHHLFTCFRNPLTWGGGDSECLRKQLGIFDTDAFLFGRRWIDAKTLFVSKMFANGLKHQSGLARSMTRLGLTFKGQKHNARYDAMNTFMIYHKLIQDFKK